MQQRNQQSWKGFSDNSPVKQSIGDEKKKEK